jgi:dUTPase
MKFVKIKSINKSRVAPIYHLTVEKNHNFFANRLCVHNCGYRNEVLVRFKYVGHHSFSADTSKIYCKGDKIAQLVIRKTEKMDFKFVDELDATERNLGGFGSTGN